MLSLCKVTQMLSLCSVLLTVTPLTEASFSFYQSGTSNGPISPVQQNLGKLFDQYRGSSSNSVLEMR